MFWHTVCYRFLLGTDQSHASGAECLADKSVLTLFPETTSGGQGLGQAKTTAPQVCTGLT